MALKSVIDWLVTPLARPMARPRGVLGTPPVGSGAINILVCDFDGPNGRQVAERLVSILKGRPRVHVQHVKRKLKLPGRSGLVEELVSAAENGRKWLFGAACDVLIWGQTAGPQEDMTIRFLCAAADGDRQAGSFGLGDNLELATNYDNDLEKLIFAAAVAAVAPRKPDQAREELARILSNATDSLLPFIDAPPPGLEKKRLVSFMTCLGTIYAAMWRVSGESSGLDRSIKAYRVVLSQTVDKDNPMPYVLTQNHMASSLQALSKRDKKPEPLKFAVECYRSIIGALGANTHANDWALAHVHMGDVLVSLSEYSDQDTYLKRASIAYQSALKIFTRQSMPGPWAQLMNQLGITLMTLSETTEGNRPLEQAASCFRQALEVRRRDVAPLLWAQTANNLGAVTFSIFRHSNNAGLLNEAASCFEGAAEVYSEHGRANTARIANNNLQRIRQLQTESG